MGWIICQRTGLLPVFNIFNTLVLFYLLCLNCFNLKKGSKIIGKSSLSLIPLIGWCWLFAESIFINRKWETDKKLLVEGLDKNLTDYPEDCYFNV
jgi:hypothetical protein